MKPIPAIVEPADLDVLAEQIASEVEAMRIDQAVAQLERAQAAVARARAAVHRRRVVILQRMLARRAR